MMTPEKKFRFSEEPEWRVNPQEYTHKLTEFLCYKGHLHLDEELRVSHFPFFHQEKPTSHLQQVEDEQPDSHLLFGDRAQISDHLDQEPPASHSDKKYNRDSFDREQPADNRDEEQIKVPSSLYLSDIQSDMASFNGTLSFASTLKTHIPAVQMGSWLLPVDILLSIKQNTTAQREYSRDPRKRNGNLLIDLILEDIWKAGLEFERLAPRDALSIFVSNVKDFLLKRIMSLGGKKGDNKPDDGPPNVLDFSVYTKTYGLTVVYDPFYLFRQGLVFGSPTSPVSAPIHPGLYVFGVKKIGVRPKWDNSIYEIPGPTDHAELLI